MARYRFDLVLLVLVVGTLAGAFSVGRDVSQPNYAPIVEGQMSRSPAYDAFSANDNFADGLTLRLPPAGTIARGQMPFPYKATPEDAVRAGLKEHNPFTSKDEKRLARGGVVFSNFCQVCHGPFGQGDGSVTLGGFPSPPSLTAERANQMPDGQMFHVLTRGQGRMPSVAPQLSQDDRWCAILYVRQLQQFRSPSEKQVPITLDSMALLFRENCSSCHGHDGKGTLLRKALPNLPDFTRLAWQASQTEMALVNQIDYGSFPLMPAFRYKLTREQILGLAIYVRSFPSRPEATISTHLSAVEVYQTYCFACHDNTGKGDPFLRLKSMPELPDFTSAAWQKSRTDQEFAVSILRGKGKYMPAMSDKLGEATPIDMVKLVRAFVGGKQKILVALPKFGGPVAPETGTGLPELPPDTPLPEIPKGPAVASGDVAYKIRMGGDIFQKYCLVCHGRDGTGNENRIMLPPIPNFRDPPWQKSKNDAELLTSILDGKGTLMPSNAERITRDQAKLVLAYVRAFDPGRVVEAAPTTEDPFQKKMRLLQWQFNQLEKQLKQLK
jgi:mono/diheme cytochrome c family protein